MTILLALALFVGAQAWDMARNYEWPAYSPPACEMRGEYLGRDDEGRPTYRYFRRCKDV